MLEFGDLVDIVLLGTHLTWPAELLASVFPSLCLIKG